MKPLSECGALWLCSLALAASGIVLAGDGGARLDESAPRAAPAKGESSGNRGVETARRTRFRHLGVNVGAGYIHHAGRYPYFGYPYGYGYYDPFFPYYYPGYFNGFSRGPRVGTVKLNTGDKGLQVFIDDGYAGTVGELKSISLEPGAYNLELRNADGDAFKKRIYVLTGKTVRVTPHFPLHGEPRSDERLPEEQP